jgi:hypothetical protein
MAELSQNFVGKEKNHQYFYRWFFLSEEELL